MIEYKDKFVADALDVLSGIEEALLESENHSNCDNSVERIFRYLHTIKGAAGMYGFKNIEHLMHLIENVYDLIRAGKIKLKKGVVDLTFEVVDHVNTVLKAKENEMQRFEPATRKLEKEIQALLDLNKTDTHKLQAKEEKIKSKERTYYITFVQDENFEVRGITPQTITENLKAVGTLIEKKHTIKENKYLWELFLVSSKPHEDIEDIFMFIDDIVEIRLLAYQNIFLSDELSRTIKNNAASGRQNNFLQLKEIIEKEKKQDETVNMPDNNENNKSKNVFLKISSDKVDEQMNLLSELVTAKAELKLITEREKYKKINKVVETIDKITNRFRKNILKIRLIPIKSLYVSLLRLTRDISGKLGKDVRFVAEGMETELDKNIIDSLESPLTHIIRNAIDHGIEPPETRKQKGKPKKGTIGLIAYHSAAHIFIEIRDDGTGIDKNEIRKKAVEGGYIDENTDLPDKKLFDLIFKPGFSTAQNLSEVSGRGVGMDIVKKAIDKLRGEIEIESELEVGTSIIIKLPLTLSIIDTMLIKSGNQFFSIPLNVISHCSQVKHSIFAKSVNNQIKLDGELLPYIYLRDTFGIKGKPPQKEKVVVIHNGDRKIGLITDKVVGEHQAVLKPLGDMFDQQEYFSGISVLADGHLSVILDTNKLVADKVQNP